MYTAESDLPFYPPRYQFFNPFAPRAAFINLETIINLIARTSTTDEKIRRWKKNKSPPFCIRFFYFYKIPLFAALSDVNDSVCDPASVFSAAFALLFVDRKFFYISSILGAFYNSQLNRIFHPSIMEFLLWRKQAVIGKKPVPLFTVDEPASRIRQLTRLRLSFRLNRFELSIDL